MMALSLNAPHWNLQPQEAEAMAVAHLKVLEQYPALQLPPKYAVLVGAAIVLNNVYAPRLKHSIMLARGARSIQQPGQEQQQRTPGKVSPFGRRTAPNSGMAPDATAGRDDRGPEAAAATKTGLEVGAGGAEIVPLTGVPDGGRILFRG